MSPKQFTRLLEQLAERGISRKFLAERIDRSRGWLYHQKIGTTPVDIHVADYTAALAIAIDGVPLPDLTMWRNVEAAAAD